MMILLAAVHGTKRQYIHVYSIIIYHLCLQVSTTFKSTIMIAKKTEARPSKTGAHSYQLSRHCQGPCNGGAACQGSQPCHFACQDD